MLRLLLALWLLGATARAQDALAWDELPPLPDAHGFAGAFAGVSGGALLVAGGANFPDGRPWEGAPKVWHRDAWVLADPASEWVRLSDALPRALAYGVAVSHGDALYVVGGGDADSHSAAVHVLRWSEDQRLTLDQRASMPTPLAFSQGALVGDTLWMAGGREAPDSAELTHALWSLDLADPQAAWQTHEPLPGRPRMLATAGTLDGGVA